MNADILIIDDDISVLRGLRRTFRSKFNIETAENGEQAIAIADEGWDFKVIVCDQRMEGIDGLTTLERLKKKLPATPGILLTGHVDVDTLQRAVNEAKVYKVIDKPCTKQILEEALTEAINAYETSLQQTRSAEKSTLGALKIVEKILQTFELAPGQNRTRVSELARLMAMKTKCAKLWEMRAALMLSELNTLRMEADRFYNRDGDRHERLAFVTDVLASIPRLSRVAEALYFKDKNFDGTGVPHNLLSGDGIPVFARAIHVILEFERLIDQGLGMIEAVTDMRKRGELFDPAFLNALEAAIEESIRTS